MKDSSIKGSMVISLDFELLWGMLDKADIAPSKTRMQGARKAVIEILQLFSEYGIHATWGIVGSLLNENAEDMHGSTPEGIPQYRDKALCSYEYYDKINDEDRDCFFAKELVDCIRNTPNQEIASHTYSHYYCLAEGQTKEDFEQDLKCFLEKISDYEAHVKTIIFPRNQINSAYVAVLQKHGINNYRGTEHAWCYQSCGEKENSLKRLYRLADAYIGLTGPNCYGYDEIREGNINNIRSSRFFRPYMPELSIFEPLRIQRIKRQMLYAAKNGKVFHLWWHPHNFGTEQEENLQNLRSILDYYTILKSQYGLESKTIAEVGVIVDAMQQKGK